MAKKKQMLRAPVSKGANQWIVDFLPTDFETYSIDERRYLTKEPGIYIFTKPSFFVGKTDVVYVGESKGLRGRMEDYSDKRLAKFGIEDVSIYHPVEDEDERKEMEDSLISRYNPSAQGKLNAD